MWKLLRKLNFPNIFRLAAIYTPAPAFKFPWQRPYTKRVAYAWVDFQKIRAFKHFKIENSLPTEG